MTDTMNIFTTKPGDFVRFTGENGYPVQREQAKRFFCVGESYEVETVILGYFDSIVTFVGVPGYFNTVLFENV